VVELGRVPILAGVRELAELDLFPSGSRRNRDSLEGKVDWGGVGETDQLLLSDAQTSGGLLVALPPDRAESFEAEFAGAPYPAVRIGEVSDGSLRVSA